MEIVHLQDSATLDPPQLPDPEAVGFGILKTEVTSNGKMSMVAFFVNNTTQDISIALRNSHLLLVKLVSKDGAIYDLNSYLPQPTPDQPPLVVKTKTEYHVVFPFDPSAPPYNGAFKFDPENAPYKLLVEVNSDSFVFTVSTIIPVKPS